MHGQSTWGKRASEIQQEGPSPFIPGSCTCPTCCLLKAIPTRTGCATPDVIMPAEDRYKVLVPSCQPSLHQCTTWSKMLSKTGMSAHSPKAVFKQISMASAQHKTHYDTKRMHISLFSCHVYGRCRACHPQLIGASSQSATLASHNACRVPAVLVSICHGIQLRHEGIRDVGGRAQQHVRRKAHNARG